MVEFGEINDHGQLQGKDDDDHTQYLTNARHAALVLAANLHAPEEHSTDKHDSAVLDTVAKLIAQLFCRIKTGQYTGDGTTSQAITGVGFQPKFVWIFPHITSSGQHDFHFKLDQFGAALATRWRVSIDVFDRAVANAIISLDSDGFTVDDQGADSHPNTDGTTYDYMALG